jgi:serine/threonine protein kinase
MHRDIKSANVFLSKDGVAKLGDMNVSKVANREGLNFTQTGTPYYARYYIIKSFMNFSPEVWRDEPYTFVSDIWSMGCVLYEILCLKPPF